LEGEGGSNFAILLSRKYLLAALLTFLIQKEKDKLPCWQSYRFAGAQAFPAIHI